jgi:hypothetical protein
MVDVAIPIYYTTGGGLNKYRSNPADLVTSAADFNYGGDAKCTKKVGREQEIRGQEGRWGD